ncbi:RNA polymerase sigma factor [Mangrovibacillus cuniculi]|uniref:RNA polymerase sigma factor n=1 Tax=Mangrovibacillus cuniculi TaxID=2593652 RepID=A0A7S8C8T6_9BACI|nr:RNA polymerase sigma factor [Mangrovibacillus cuniculi]QPC45511.1 RNA polymerase sigma factor [Mangrovibacillus cuniculi]
MIIKDLVKSAKQGNKEALLTLILEDKDDYYRLAYSYVGNQHDAMDAMEDMIVKIYEKIHQLRKPEMFYSWSRSILVNSCKDQLRKRKKIILVDEFATTADAHNPHTQQEAVLEVHYLLEHINEHQREAITLKYLHDLDYKTIAAITNVSIGTVKSRIFQGMNKLRDIVRRDLND